MRFLGYNLKKFRLILGSNPVRFTVIPIKVILKISGKKMSQILNYELKEEENAEKS